MKRLRSALWLPVALTAALGTQGCAAGIVPAESYRLGIRDTLDKLQGNGLPMVRLPKQPENLYYVGPVMDEVWIPAQVVGGMVIPAHRQWVLVRPGTWQVPNARGQLAGTQRTF